MYCEMYLTPYLFVFGQTVTLAGEILHGHDNDVGGKEGLKASIYFFYLSFISRL